MASDKFIRGDSDKIHQAENTRGYGYANFPPPAPPPPAAPKIEPEPSRPDPEPAKPERSKAERKADSPRLPSASQALSSLMAVPSGRKATAQTVVVGRAAAAVWSERSFLAERVGDVRSGESLTVVADEGPWLHIRYGTKIEGWVRSGELGAYQDPYEGLGEREDLI